MKRCRLKTFCKFFSLKQGCFFVCFFEWLSVPAGLFIPQIFFKIHQHNSSVFISAFLYYYIMIQLISWSLSTGIFLYLFNGITYCLLPWCIWKILSHIYLFYYIIVKVYKIYFGIQHMDFEWYNIWWVIEATIAGYFVFMIYSYVLEQAEDDEAVRHSPTELRRL